MNFRSFLIFVQFLICLSTVNGMAIGHDINKCHFMVKMPQIAVPTSDYRVICNKIPGIQQYTAIRNACTCVNTQVTPAPIARVERDLTAATPAPECDGSGCNAVADPEPFGERGSAFCPPCACDPSRGSPSGYPVSQEPPGPDGIDEPAVAVDPCTCTGPPPAAVDPVSLILAQANRRQGGGVREERLAFGQIAVPKNARPPAASGPDVDEEGLYALDKAIVELKTASKRSGRQGDALAPNADALLAFEEDALQDEDAAATRPEVSLPSYADAGYQTETPSCAPLIGGVSVPPAAVRPNSNTYYGAAAKGCKGECTCGKCSSGKCSKAKCSCGCS